MSCVIQFVLVLYARSCPLAGMLRDAQVMLPGFHAFPFDDVAGFRGVCVRGGNAARELGGFRALQVAEASLRFLKQRGGDNGSAVR